MDDLPDATDPTVARWTGELLFPVSLDEAAIIDLSGVSALGTWTYEWFRARPHLAASGASPALRKQLQKAKLPLAWADLPAGSGVSPIERAALFDDA
jgi:hypothetical protein